MSYGVSRPTRRKRMVRAFNHETARQALEQAGFGRGREVFGFTKGHFSFIDVIEAAMRWTGPADLVIATWTAADADLRRIGMQMENEHIRSVRWLVDYSFETRQPGFCQTMRRLFGAEAIRTTKCHAKFALLQSDDWKVVLQTSMNLNFNKRIENFWIGDDPELFDAYLELVAEIFDFHKPSDTFGRNPGYKKAEFARFGQEPDPLESIGSVGTFGSEIPTLDDF